MYESLRCLPALSVGASFITLSALTSFPTAGTSPEASLTGGLLFALGLVCVGRGIVTHCEHRNASKARTGRHEVEIPSSGGGAN